MILPLEQQSIPSRKNPLATPRAARPPGGPRPQRLIPRAPGPRTQVGKLLLSLSEGLMIAELRTLQAGRLALLWAFPRGPKEAIDSAPKDEGQWQEINEDRGQTHRSPLSSAPTLDSHPGSALSLERSPREWKNGEWKPQPRLLERITTAQRVLMGPYKAVQNLVGSLVVSD